VTVSSERISRWVRVQPAVNGPAAAVFHVQSGSFHSSQPSMLVVPVALSRACTIVRTLASQSAQLTQRYGKFG
jgi:hypothetical protein